MTHRTAQIHHRPGTWSCTCGAEWGGTRKTCPSVRHARNLARRRIRQAGKTTHTQLERVAPLHESSSLTQYTSPSPVGNSGTTSKGAMQC